MTFPTPHPRQTLFIHQSPHFPPRNSLPNHPYLCSRHSLHLTWGLFALLDLVQLSQFTDDKTEAQGFPGGAVVENLPANAGDTGSSPGLGRSHMPQSNWARDPQLLSLRIWSLCSATREAAIVRGLRTAMKSGPHLPQLEKALAQKRRPNTAINK